jgi:hypothetical protein
MFQVPARLTFAFQRPENGLSAFRATWRTLNHFGGLLPNEPDTSGHGLSVTCFLWVSQTNLETCGHSARYFTGFTHLKASQLPSNVASNLGPPVMSAPLARIPPTHGPIRLPLCREFPARLCRKDREVLGYTTGRLQKAPTVRVACWWFYIATDRIVKGRRSAHAPTSSTLRRNL